MRKTVLLCAFAALLLGWSVCVARSPQESAQTKHVRVFVEGDTSDIPKFVKLAQEKGPERNLSFEFTRDKEADWDIRVVLSAEGRARIYLTDRHLPDRVLS